MPPCTRSFNIGAGNNKVYLEQNWRFDHADGTTSAIIDYDPGLGGGLGSGNEVLIGTILNGRNCTATLAQAPQTSTHELVVDKVVVSNFTAIQGAPAALIVSDETTIGELIVDPDTEVSVQAPLSVVSSGSTSGKLMSEGTVEFTGASDPSFIHQFDIRESLTTSTGVVNVLPVANVVARTSSKIGALNISVDGTFTLQQRSDSPSQTNARLLSLGSLFIQKMPIAPEGILDLKNNSMLIDYVESSPHDDIRDYITHAYNGGAWDDFGINSSIAATRSDVGIGYAEATDIFTFPLPTPPPTFEGQVPDDTMVLVKYTFYGDANLSGHVSLPDFNRLAANFGQSPRGWSQGDFNYDQAVTLADFNRLASNFGAGGLAPGEESYTYEELEEMLEG